MPPGTQQDVDKLREEIQALDDEIEKLVNELVPTGEQVTWIWHCPSCKELNIEPEGNTFDKCELCGADKPSKPALSLNESTKALPAKEETVRSPPRSEKLVEAMSKTSEPQLTASKPANVASPAKLPPQDLLTGWVCDSCMSKNNEKDDQCSICFADRSLRNPSSKEEWTCSACFHRNPVFDNQCVLCFAEREEAIQKSQEISCKACLSRLPVDASQCPVCFTDVEEVDGVWKCVACGITNPLNLPECSMCFAERDSESAGWICPACLSMNRSDDEECRICAADRPETGAPTSSATFKAANSSNALNKAVPHEWLCIACMSTNDWTLSECSICSADRPSNIKGKGWTCVACFSLNDVRSKECVICMADREELPVMNDPTVLDLSFGKRELLDGARARALFSVVERPESVKKLIFKTKSFGAEASAVAAEMLQKMINVEDVDFSDIIAGRPTDEALNVLRTMCEALPLSRVKTFDLSDNAIGERGMRVLSNAIQKVSQSIEVLNFRSNGLSEKSIALLVEALGSAPRLRGLHFYSNMCGNGGAVELAPLFEKQALVKDRPFEFTMSSCRVRTDGTLALAKSLALVSHRLISLDLNDSTMGERGGVAMADTLMKCSHLNSLSLHDPALEGPASSAIIGALTKMPELVKLDLTEAALGRKAVKELLQSLNANNRKLEKLGLAGNEATTAGMGTLVDPGSFPSVHSLDLKSNELEDDFAIKLIAEWSGRPLLQTVELGGNNFSEGIVLQLQTAFGARLGLDGADE